MRVNRTEFAKERWGWNTDWVTWDTSHECGVGHSISEAINRTVSKGQSNITEGRAISFHVASWVSIPYASKNQAKIINWPQSPSKPLALLSMAPK